MINKEAELYVMRSTSDWMDSNREKIKKEMKYLISFLITKLEDLSDNNDYNYISLIDALIFDLDNLYHSELSLVSQEYNKKESK